MVIVLIKIPQLTTRSPWRPISNTQITTNITRLNLENTFLIENLKESYSQDEVYLYNKNKSKTLHAETRVTTYMHIYSMLF